MDNSAGHPGKMKGLKMSTSPVAPAGTKILEKSYSYFDMDSFEVKKEKVEVPFTPAKDFNEAVQRFNSDQEKLVEALNAALQRATLSDAAKAVKAKGPSKKIVYDTIRGLRALEPYASMNPEPGTKEGRKAQTAALLELVKSTPAIMEAIRVTSLKAAEAGEDDEDGEDE